MNAAIHKYRVSRSLAVGELEAIRDNIRRAQTSNQLLVTVITGLYNALMSDLGQSMANLGGDQQLVPTEYAIPSTQWESIRHEATNRAAAWGTSFHVGLEMINLKPDTYDDPQAPTLIPDSTDYRPRFHHLRLTREAVDTIAAVNQYLEALDTAYGSASPVYREAADSWHQQLTSLFGMGLGGDTVVRSDGPPGSLSLLVETASGVVFGIIFHRDRRHCLVPGCDARIPDDGTVRPDNPQQGIYDHEHQPSYPFDAPPPGRWLAHS